MDIMPKTYIWNLDETGCYWRALPEKGFGEKGKECKGGKKAKQRVTIAFVVNAAGESEVKPIVIWKLENPRCFKNVDKKRLPVQYFSQSTIYGKTFEGENFRGFHGFSANRKSFPLESFAVYST